MLPLLLETVLDLGYLSEFLPLKQCFCMILLKSNLSSWLFIDFNFQFITTDLGRFSKALSVLFFIFSPYNPFFSINSTFFSFYGFSKFRGFFLIWINFAAWLVTEGFLLANRFCAGEVVLESTLGVTKFIRVDCYEGSFSLIGKFSKRLSLFNLSDSIFDCSVV